MTKIMIGTMVKNSGKWLNQFFANLKELTFKDFRLVVIFGNSSDNSLDILKQEKNNFNMDVYKENTDVNLRLGGAQMAASIYNEWKGLMKDDEDYFMLLDSDVISTPPNLIEQLIAVDADIVAPYTWSENHRHFYDSWIFRLDNLRFSPESPPGSGLDYPIYVDSVGTCFLAKRETYITVPIQNPYPNLTFCNNARTFGYDVVACPYIEICHIDLEKLDPPIMHPPMNPELGLYPRSNEFIDSNYPVVKYEKHCVLS